LHSLLIVSALRVDATLTYFLFLFFLVYGRVMGVFFAYTTDRSKSSRNLGLGATICFIVYRLKTKT
jgi:hypothetical protein